MQPLTPLGFVYSLQTLLVEVCGYTFSGTNIHKSHKPLLSNNLGVYEHAQDWRVRPYSAARDSKSLCISRDIWVVNTGTKFCFYFFTLTSEGKLELEKCNKSFSLLPWEFVGTLVDKFLNRALANKAWPHGH